MTDKALETKQNIHDATVYIGVWDRLYGEDASSIQLGITHAARVKENAIKSLLEEYGFTFFWYRRP